MEECVLGTRRSCVSGPHGRACLCFDPLLATMQINAGVLKCKNNEGHILYML